MAQQTRYRGAQPFSDDTLSQRTFFGREEASASLMDQILANRLVVVYAKSGLGKSSLLNAGVAPRLREAGFQPLMVRVNDVHQDVLAAVVQGIASEAARQRVEYVPGLPQSLWSFFKTVEFWRGDLMLTPVLILDQFEELFTLQSDAAREAFLSELSFAVRGLRPPSESAETQSLSDAPPLLHVVLSLREDFLGLLDDAADRIPQIMDHRFRLVPLSREFAAEAMKGPAMVDDPAFSTPPFTLSQGFIDAVLDYLTAPTFAAPGPVKRYIEPFHLQLICQRVEQIVVARQLSPSSKMPAFDMAAFGGVAALAYTLKNFYSNAILTVSERHLRPVARRLCEDFLISPEGRRLSFEEHELRRQLKLSERALTELAECRLLRTDRRSDSTYYELSHDALVEPVLATRRTQALLQGWAAIILGGAFAAVSGLLGLLVPVLMLNIVEKDDKNQVMGGFVILVLCAFMFIGSYRVFKMGSRTRARFRRRDARGGPLPPVPTFVRLRDRILGRTMVAAGVGIVGMSAFILLVLAVLLALLFANHGHLPAAMQEFGSPELLSMYQRPVQEVGWVLVCSLSVILLGAAFVRAGRRRLRLNADAPLQWPQPSAGQPWAARWLSAGAWRFYANAALFLFGAVGGYVMLRCAHLSQGSLPGWLSPQLLPADMAASCHRIFADRWNADDVGSAVGIVSALVVSLLGLRMPLIGLWRQLRRGIARPGVTAATVDLPK